MIKTFTKTDLETCIYRVRNAGGGMPKNIMIGVRRKPPPTPTNPIIRPRNAPTPKIASE